MNRVPFLPPPCPIHALAACTFNDHSYSFTVLFHILYQSWRVLAFIHYCHHLFILTKKQHIKADYADPSGLHLAYKSIWLLCEILRQFSFL